MINNKRKLIENQACKMTQFRIINLKSIYNDLIKRQSLTAHVALSCTD